MTKDELKTFIRNSGFDDVGIAPSLPQTWPAFSQWLKKNYHGEMAYLERRAQERLNPSHVHSPTRSVIVVAQGYKTVEPIPGRPVISRYAWGDDYHEVMGKKLKRITQWIHDQTQGRHSARWCVDTAPVLEKDFAAQAGLGWIGKHTNVLSRSLSNWFFLGVILTSLPLEPDQPSAPHCGSCTRCIDVCPTQAFVQPYVLDARRCISYLTIELKGSIPVELRPAIGLRIFGCDDCLEVCPWNRFAQASHESNFYPREKITSASLIDFMKITEVEFRILFKKSPIKRIKRRGFLRNVSVALGNTGGRRAIPVLQDALHDPEPLIREHAAWALTCLKTT